MTPAVPLRVLLAGGGTAGHTSPLLATAEALTELVPGVEITCLGTERGLEVTLIPAAGYPLELVAPVPLPRRLSTDLARVPLRLRATVRAAVDVIDRVRPDVVVGFGGYVSVPAYLAARRRKVAIVVHEGNAVPGVANKLGARFTTHVATSFATSKLPHAVCTGLPIRALISQLDRASVRTQARAHFGLDPVVPVLLVTGGSQGAQRINEAVSGAAPALAAAGVAVLHVIGAKNELSVPTGPGAPPYIVLPYVDRIDLAYAAADFVVCRAGANTVAEVAAVGLPAAFVPLPIGNGEQALNAHPVVDAGGALLVDDQTMTADWVASTIPGLISDSERLAAMASAAQSIMPRDAGFTVARMIVEAAGEKA